MTFLLPLLLGAIFGGLIGLCAGWLARGREEVVVEKTITVEKIVPSSPDVADRKQDDVEQKRHQANEVLAQLQLLTMGVSEKIDAHNRTVGGINDELTSGGGNAAEVVDAIRRLVDSNNAMQSQLQNAQAQLQEQANLLEAKQEEAHTDQLTKLRNRRAFDDEIARRIADFEQRRTPVVLMMVDVDHFKKFNDTYGHLAGDEVLRMVGRVLAQSALSQRGLFVARYGGEEFAVLLSGHPLEDAAPACDCIRASIERSPVAFEGQTLKVTASAGVALIRPGENAAGFISRADEALYAAKRSGRNCACVQDGDIRKIAGGPSVPAAPPASAPRKAAPAAGSGQEDDLLTSTNRRIAEWRRGGSPLALVVARIDNLSAIEAKQGDEGKGKAMDLAGEFLKRSLRDMDQLNRVASEIFGMLLPNATLADAALTAERMRAGLQNGPFEKALGAAITVSFGIAEAATEDDGDSLLLRARRALESARRSGGNTVYVNDGVASKAGKDLIDLHAGQAVAAK